MAQLKICLNFLFSNLGFNDSFKRWRRRPIDLKTYQQNNLDSTKSPRPTTKKFIFNFIEVYPMCCWVGSVCFVYTGYISSESDESFTLSFLFRTYTFSTHTRATSNISIRDNFLCCCCLEMCDVRIELNAISSMLTFAICCVYSRAAE